MSRPQRSAVAADWLRGRMYWAVALVLGALALAVLPSAFAAPGDSAAEALPIGPDGRFHGLTAPESSTWFHFRYQGGNEEVTITTEYQPADSILTELILYTGSPDELERQPGDATRDENRLTRTFSHADPRDVFVRFVNNHAQRSISFLGALSPVAAAATPAPETPTPTPGPVAGAAHAAITVGADGRVAGTIGPQRAVWYRFWYGNPGADATIRVSFAESADGADLNLFTGPDPDNLTRQEGEPTRENDTLSRRVNLAAEQFVFFTAVNNTQVQTFAYAGRVSPAFAPPPTPTPEPEVTPTPTPTPAPPPEAPPAVPHDQRYFFETGFRIDNDAIWNHFNARGRLDIFGFPVSRTFQLLGCDVQIFQRQIAQVCPDRNPAFMNVLDPDIFPYTEVNFSTFPSVDEGMKARTPEVGEPDYDQRILQFVRDNVPDVFQGVQVNFEQTFFGLITPEMAGTNDPGLLGMINLEAWGAPISEPARDPNNANFIYQRFQRGIMHHDTATGVTRGILLADYLKQVMRDSDELPPDLRQQAEGTRFFAQYCPNETGWLCRPGELPGTGLTFAFERG